MMRIDIGHLTTVLVLAEVGSMRKASAALQLSPAALAAKLRRIEQTLGGRLFLRQDDSAQLTELGRNFVPRAQDVVDSFDALRQRAAELAQPQETTQLRIATGRNLSLRELIEAAETVWPDSQLTVREGSTAELFLALSQQLIDVAVMAGYGGFAPPEPRGSRARLIVGGEPAFIVLPEEHPLAAEKEVDLARLASEDWILVSPGDRSGRYESLRAACGQAGFAPRLRHEIGEWDTIVRLVRAGRGIGLASPLSRPPEGVTHRPLAGNPIARDLVARWRLASSAAPRADRLVEHLGRAYLREMEQSPVYRDWWHRNRAAVTTWED